MIRKLKRLFKNNHKNSQTNFSNKQTQSRMSYDETFYQNIVNQKKYNNSSNYKFDYDYSKQYNEDKTYFSDLDFRYEIYDCEILEILSNSISKISTENQEIYNIENRDLTSNSSTSDLSVDNIPDLCNFKENETQLNNEDFRYCQSDLSIKNFSPFLKLYPLGYIVYNEDSYCEIQSIKPPGKHEINSRLVQTNNIQCESVFSKRNESEFNCYFNIMIPESLRTLKDFLKCRNIDTYKFHNEKLFRNFMKANNFPGTALSYENYLKCREVNHPAIIQQIENILPVEIDVTDSFANYKNNYDYDQARIYSIQGSDKAVVYEAYKYFELTWPDDEIILDVKSNDNNNCNFDSISDLDLFTIENVNNEFIQYPIENPAEDKLELTVPNDSSTINTGKAKRLIKMFDSFATITSKN